MRIKGFAREIINRFQKLKKKAGVKQDDDIFLFYHFGGNAENLNKAITDELEMIKHAVKKPIFPITKKGLFVDISKDSGEILGEKYDIFICYPHFVVNDQAFEVTEYLFRVNLVQKLRS